MNDLKASVPLIDAASAARPAEMMTPAEAARWLHDRMVNDHYAPETIEVRRGWEGGWHVWVNNIPAYRENKSGGKFELETLRANFKTIDGAVRHANQVLDELIELVGLEKVFNHSVTINTRELRDDALVKKARARKLALARSAEILALAQPQAEAK